MMWSLVYTRQLSSHRENDGSKRTLNRSSAVCMPARHCLTSPASFERLTITRNRSLRRFDPTLHACRVSRDLTTHLSSISDIREIHGFASHRSSSTKGSKISSSNTAASDPKPSHRARTRSTILLICCAKAITAFQSSSSVSTSCTTSENGSNPI